MPSQKSTRPGTDSPREPDPSSAHRRKTSPYPITRYCTNALRSMKACLVWYFQYQRFSQNPKRTRGKPLSPNEAWESRGD